MDSMTLYSRRFEDFQIDPEDQVLFNEVVAILNDLGHFNRLTNKYQLNLTDHNVCLRDLIRFLRNDGQNFLVRRQMGISNIVDNDLLPIVEQHTVSDNRQITSTGKTLMDKIIRLLVDLTNPTVLHYPNQKIPKDDKHDMNVYMELQNYLFQYKLSFSLRKRFWIVLSKFLTRILELNPENRQVEDELMMERIIILIRNVLHIPIISKGKETEDSNVHDRIIEQMNTSGLLDIFQYMISSGEYNQYCFHLLEIMFLIFREQNAEFLVKSVESDRNLENDKNGSSNKSTSQIHNIGRSQYEREFDCKEFEETQNRDRQEYLKMIDTFKGDDYTRFKETAFVIKNMKAVSDRDMICYRAYSNPEKAMDFNKNKIAQRRPRNRRPMNESVGNSDSFGAQQIHRSSRQLRLILYDFCTKFLSESYNQFMVEIRMNLIRGTAQEHDETYFLWACQFFMEFNRHQTNITREQRYQQVYETLSTSMFHYIQTIVDDYIDHLFQKKEFKSELSDWSKRLHRALRSYRELLYSLSCIESMNLPSASKMCYHIKTDIFTEPEYREMLLRLMQSYNEEKMSKAYLRDLIETNHLFLKMLEYHSKISLDFKIKVKKRKRTKRKKETKKTTDDNEDNDDNSEKKEEVNKNGTNEKDFAPELIWMEIIDEVGEVLNTELNVENLLGSELIKSLFDPLSNKSLDEQKMSIMKTINKFLRQKEVKKAVALFREARNALAGVDEDCVFGEIGIEIDDEMIALNSILMTEFPKEKLPQKKTEKQENDDDEPESDEADEVTEIQEKNFSIQDTLMRYAHPNSVRACRLLLRYYRTNSPVTNHAIAKMMYRIAVNLKMKPMFYNLGYFILFEQIMDDPLLRYSTNKNCPRYKSICELATFAFYIMRNFFKLLSKYPRIASEICFTVTSREAYQMEYGFDNEMVTQMIREKKGLSWSEAQQLELEVLFNEYKDKGTKEKDVIDLIQEHLIDDTKTRRQIIKQLKKMDLLQTNDIKKNSYKTSTWSDQEVEELRNLYEKFKDNLEYEEIEKEPELTTTIEESFLDDNQQDKQFYNDDKEESNKKGLNSKKTKKRLDIIDCILKHLSTPQRNRRQIIRQLKISNIYDHSAAKKWTKEQIEELRILFCNLFIDFKQCQLINLIGDDETKTNDIIVGEKVYKENFMDKLLEKFSDKTKSTRQILKQLRKMEFHNNLKTIGIFNDKSSLSKNNSKDDDLSSDDECKDENEDEVIIQYDDDEDEDEDEDDENNDNSYETYENNKLCVTQDEIPADKSKLNKNRERLTQMANKILSNNNEEDDDELNDNSIQMLETKKYGNIMEDDGVYSDTDQQTNNEILTSKKSFKKIQLDSDSDYENDLEVFNINSTIDSGLINYDDDQQVSSKRNLIESDDENQQEETNVKKKRRSLYVIYDNDNDEDD